MAIEILSVGLEDETIQKLADAVVSRLGGNSATQSNPPTPNSQSPQSTGSQNQEEDPWLSSPQGQQEQAQQNNVPRCQHGEMRFVPAGYSKNGGKPYDAFYGCPAPRGQQQCKSVKA
jgi:hypothetical protein